MEIPSFNLITKMDLSHLSNYISLKSFGQFSLQSQDFYVLFLPNVRTDCEKDLVIMHPQTGIFCRLL